jgi:hypothetical protein
VVNIPEKVWTPNVAFQRRRIRDFCPLANQEQKKWMKSLDRE